MAQEVVDYHEQLRRLHPRFDSCPEPCAETGEERSDNCDSCEVRMQWEQFKESFDEQFKEQFGEGAGWKFDELYRDVLHAMSNDTERRGRGYPRGCSALLARCIDIVRAEKFRPVRAERWEAERQRERDARTR